MPFVEDDNVIQAFAPYGPDNSLAGVKAEPFSIAVGNHCQLLTQGGRCHFWNWALICV
jgi:hypothetical protein